MIDYMHNQYIYIYIYIYTYDYSTIFIYTRLWVGDNIGMSPRDLSAKIIS